MTPSTTPDEAGSDPAWPYPSYADRVWLGGGRGPDRALATVVRALRGLVAETGGPATPEAGAPLPAPGRPPPFRGRGGRGLGGPRRRPRRPGGGLPGTRRPPRGDN